MELAGFWEVLVEHKPIKFDNERLTHRRNRGKFCVGTLSFRTSIDISLPYSPRRCQYQARGT
jgi:hypothetical protein